MYTDVRARAEPALPVRCPPAHKPSKAGHLRARPDENVSKEPGLKMSASASLCGATKAATAAVRAAARADARRDARRGRCAARARRGGEGAPYGELEDAEQRAGTSSVTRHACREAATGGEYALGAHEGDQGERAERPTKREEDGKLPSSTHSEGPAKLTGEDRVSEARDGSGGNGR